MYQELLSTVMLVVITGLIAWLSFDGYNKTTKCLDEDAGDGKKLLTAQRVNGISLGLAIGMGLYALVPKAIIGELTIMGFALTVGAISSVAINAFAQLSEGCKDLAKVRSNERVIYVLLGMSIGVFTYALLIKGLKTVGKPTLTSRIAALLAAIYVIVLSSTNIQTSKECGDVTGKGFRTANIAYVSTAVILTLMLAASFYFAPV